MTDQLEYGYTQIAHTILERLARAQMPANAFRIILWAIRNTYGYKRKETLPISIRGLSEQVDMPLCSVHDSLKFLSEIGLLIRTETGGFFFDKMAIGVRPTEQPPLFGPPNKSVRPTERNVRSTEHRECNILKDTRKIEKDRGEVPPTFREVEDYCKDQKINVNPRRFFDFYESTNWHKGNRLLTDWKGELSIWSKTERKWKEGPSAAQIKANNQFKAQEEYNEYIEKQEKWHQEHIKGGRCGFCGKVVVGISVCDCGAYSQAFQAWKEEQERVGQVG